MAPFARLAACIDSFPRVRLIAQATLLERLSRLECHLGREGLFAKRDDAMALGLGGNKLRSLEFWLGAALASDADVIIVAGAQPSNQVRLTAAACAKLGLECRVLYDGDPPEREEGNLRLTKIFGPEVRFLGPVDEHERAAAAREESESLRRRGRRPYVIGDPITGALGYVECAAELFLQARDLEIKLDNIVLPGSMGTTEAGFIFGCALLGYPAHIHLVSVEYPQTVLADRIAAILEGLSASSGASPPVCGSVPVTYRMDQLGDGYGKATGASRETADVFGRLEGLLLEQTYTAKTFAGLLALARELPQAETICGIHTGGVPTVLSSDLQ